MFQFPSLALPGLCIQPGVTGHDPSSVSRFGDPWIYGRLTPPQGLSQPPTSFFASQCLGIHHVRLITCCIDARARYRVLKQRANPRKCRKPGRKDRAQRGVAARKVSQPFRAAQRAELPAGVTVRSLPAQVQASPNGDPTVQDHQ
jgi:hypothetical protein